MNLKKISTISLLALMFLFLLAEVAFRLIGAVDFPLYEIDQQSHYSLKRSQNGSFLNKNEWFVNSRGFNNKEEIDLKNSFVFLVGDSVVYGGNPVNYDDRIGVKLEGLLNKNVYVGAVGGWSLFNEMEFINKNIDVAKNADLVVIQYDYGDLWDYAKESEKNGVIHPTSKPISATYYYVEKYMFPKIAKFQPKTDLPSIPTKSEMNGPWEKELLSLSEKLNKKILFVLYPDIKVYPDKNVWEKQTKDIKEFIGKHKDRFAYIDIAESTQWSTNLYRDGVHPNKDGNLVIAEEIADFIKQQN